MSACATSAPTNESATIAARGSSLVEAFASQEIGQVRLFAAGENVLNADWNEAEFATTSWPREGPMTEFYLTPGARRTLTAGRELGV